MVTLMEAKLKPQERSDTHGEMLILSPSGAGPWTPATEDTTSISSVTIERIRFNCHKSLIIKDLNEENTRFCIFLAF